MMRRVYNKGILFLIVAMTIASLVLYVQTVFAQPNLELNYQGKLTDDGGVSVTDGDYNMRFYLYNTTGGATTTAIWTEEWLVSASNGVPVTNGLFSTMLGSTTDISGVDFNQTLYLGVEIGGTGVSPTWDGEMSPRKILGTVPAAFEAQQLDGLATSSFLRADEADTLEASSTGSLLTLIQNGTGAIFDAINSSAESVFKVFDSGVVTIGTSTADSIATTTGLAVVNKDVEVRIATGTAIVARDYIIDETEGATELNTPLGLIVRDDIAYVSAFGDGGIQILDVSDPDNISVINNLQNGTNGINANSTYNFALKGNYLFYTSEGDSIEVINVSNPYNPQFVGDIDAGENGALLDLPRNIEIRGNVAYVASVNSNSFESFDISDPTNIVPLDSVVDTDISPRELVIDGNYAYVASQLQFDQHIYDISDPTNMRVAATVPSSQRASGVAVKDGYAYYSIFSTNGVEIVDVSDPYNPVVVRTMSAGENGAFKGAGRMHIAGDYLFLITQFSNDAIEVIDISSSTNPIGIGEIVHNGVDVFLEQGYDLQIVGDKVYTVANTSDAFQIFDIAGLITPTAEIGNLVSDDIKTDNLRVTQGLTVDDSLNVGTNALIGGALTITGTASSGLQASNVNPALVVTSGYVGIGTTSPYADLSIDGDIALTGGLYDSAYSLGLNGYVLQTDGTNVTWVATSTLGISGGSGSSLFTDGGDITYLTDSTDVLAIGTSTDIATSTGLAVYNRDIEILIGTGTPLWGVGSITDGNNGATELNGAVGLVVRDGYAYVVANDDAGLQIIDISDPANPIGVGSIDDDTNGADTLSGAMDIAIQGNYAYIASQLDDGIQIIDISDPTNPTGVGSIIDGENGADELDGARGVDVQGNYLYVAAYVDNGLQIIDISDPTNPIGVGSITDESNGADELDGAHNVTVVGNYAYVPADDDAGFQVIDVSDPTNPVGVGSITEGSNGADELIGAQSVVIKDNYAYVSATDDNGVQIIDISDPTNPTGVGSIGDGESGATELTRARDLDIAGNYLFVTGELDAGIQIIDVSSSTNPIGVGGVQNGENGVDEMAFPNQIIVQGNYIYVADFGDDSLQIIEIGAGLIAPTAEIGNLLTNDIETDFLRVTQSLIADSSLNVGQNAMIGGTLSVVGSASSTLQGDGAQAAVAVLSGGIGVGTTTLDTGTGIGVYNRDILTFVADPIFIDGFGGDATTSLDGAQDAEIVGDLMYVAGDQNTDGLHIVDISDPENLVGLGAITDGENGANTLADATSVDVQGNYAYLTGSTDDGLQIIDISDPLNLRGVGSISSSSGALLDRAWDVVVDGNYAYVVSLNSDALSVIDISDPTNPIEVGSIADGDNGATELNGPADIVKRGNILFIASFNDSGVQAIDVSDPTNPIGLGEISDDSSTALTNPAGNSLTLIDNFLYVGVGGSEDAQQIIDVTDPSNLVAVASTSFSGFDANGVMTVVGDYAFAFDGTNGGLLTLDVSSSSNPVVVGSYIDGSVCWNGIKDIVESKGYLYLPCTNGGSDGAFVMKIPNVVTPTAEIGNLLAQNIETDYIRVTQALTVDSGLNIATNAMIDGVLTIVGTASSSLLGESTNAALAITSGALAVGTSTDIDTTTGVAVYNKDIEISIGTGTPMWGVGSIDNASTLSEATDVTVVGDHAYVTGHLSNRVEIIDISDPTNPTVTGSIIDGTNGVDRLAGPWSTIVSGNYAYITAENDSPDSVQIVDISNPANPIGIASIGDGENEATELAGARGMALQGEYLYVAGFNDNGIQVINVSDPASPVGVGSIVDGGSVELTTTANLSIKGNYLYAATFSGVVQVIDISDPANPTGVGQVSSGLTALWDIEISGQYAYVTDFSGSAFHIIDISDPTNPAVVGTIADDTNGATHLGNANYVSVVGNYAFVTANSEDAVQIIDISSSTNPIGVGSIVDGERGATELNGARGIAVSGGYAYVAGLNDTGFQVLTLPGLISPTAEIGNLLTNDIETDYLRVTQSLIADSSLNVGTNAMIGGTLTVGGTASSSLINDSTDASLAIISGGIGIGTSTDIATTTGVAVYNQDVAVLVGTGTPMWGVGSVTDGNSGTNELNGAADIVVRGDLAYVISTNDDGLEIVDISDPTNPVSAGNINDGINGANLLNGPQGIDVIGNYAYIVVDQETVDGLQILDISNPANIRGVGSIVNDTAGADILDDAQDVTVQGSYAYVASYEGVQVVDVSDPIEPIGVGSVSLSAGTVFARSIEVQGSYAYIAGYDVDSVQIIDISDPTNPIFVAELSGNATDSYPHDLKVRGKYLYSVSDFGSLRILDVSDPYSPVLVGSLSSSEAELLGANQGIDLAGDYAFITNDNVASPGVQIIDISSSTNPVPAGSIIDGENGADTLDGADKIVIQGGYAYVVSGSSDNGLQIIDLGSFIAPTAEIGNLLAGTINTDYVRVTQALAADSSLNVSGNTLVGGTFTVVGNASSSLQSDTTQAALAVLSGAVGVGTSTDIATTTGLAVYNKDIELSIGDLELVGFADSLSPQDIEISGDLALILAESNVGNEAEVYDISDPTNPTQLFGLQGSPLYAGEVSGDYVYIGADGSDDLFVYDFSDPTAPVGVSSLSGFAGLYDLELQGNYLYGVTGGSGVGEGLVVIDVSDPLNPTEVGYVNPTNTTAAFTLEVVGNYAYVGGNGDPTEFAVIDISDPTNPIQTAGQESADTMLELLIDGRYAYGFSQFGTPEFQTYDISDKTNVPAPTFVTLDQSVYGADQAGDYVFLAMETNSNEELQIWNVASSTNPVKVGGVELGAVAASVKVYGGYLYVGGFVSGQGLQVYKLPSFITPSANIGNILATDVETEYLRVTQSLSTDGSLNVGTDALINGSLTISGTASSSLLSSNTNPALVITSGYLAIGTSSPYAEVSVVGDMAITGGIYDNTGSLGTADYLLQSTGTGVQWVDTASLGIGVGGSSLFTDGGDITYLTSLTDVLAIGTSTDIATSTGVAVFNRDIEVLVGTGTPMYGVGSVTDGNNGADRLENAFGIKVVGDYAYVTSPADGGGAIQILDISDPTNPVGVGARSNIDNGSLDIENATNLEVSGNYAYVAGRLAAGIEIFDISNPTSPIGVGSITDGNNGADTLSAVVGVAIQGSYLYTTSVNDDGLQIIDISDPVNPIGVGSITDGNNGADTLQDSRDVEVRGNYAYVVSRLDDGFQVIDISDPTNPVGVGSITDGANGATELNGPRALRISGNYAYVAAEDDNGVQIIDISDPTNPTGVGAITDNDNGAVYLDGPLDLELVGDYLFVASNDENGIQIIDVSSSTNPTGVGSIADGTNGADTLSGPVKLTAQGNYLYVASEGDNGVQIIDIGGLIAPTAEIGRLASDVIETGELNVNQSLSTDALNVNTNALVGGTLSVVGNASSTQQDGSTAVALGVVSGGISIGSSTQSIATSTGISLFNKDVDIAIGTGTALYGIWSTDENENGVGPLGSPVDVKVVDGYAYITSTDDDLLQVIDVSDPANSTGVSSIASTSGALIEGAYGVDVVGNYAYVTGRDSNALQVIDVSNPSNMIALGNTTESMNAPQALTVVGSYAYVGSRLNDTLVIVDISDPLAPTVVGTYSGTLNRPVAVAVQGNYVYVASAASDQIDIIDVSDPTSPVRTGFLDDDDTSAIALDDVGSIVVSGNFAYAGSRNEGVQIIDISDPTNPTAAGNIADGENGADHLSDPRGDMELIGDYLFVTDWTGRAVQVLDVSSSTNPIGIASVQNGENNTDQLFRPWGITSQGGYVYVTGEDSDGLQILEIPDLITPSAQIGNLLATGIESNFVRVTQSLAVDGGLNIGGNALIGGTLTITGAASSSLLSGNANAALLVTSGYVGIGTTTPYADLSVAGDIVFTGGLVAGGSLGTNGQVLQSTGSGFEWIATSSVGGSSLFTDGGDITYLTSLTDVLAIGTTTDIATSTGVAVFNRDIEVLAGDPIARGSITDDGSTLLDGAYVIEVVGDYAYIGGRDGTTGLQILDISDPDNPTTVGSLADDSATVFLNSVAGIAVQGNYAYVTSYTDDNVSVIDISDPTDPIIVGSISDGTNNATELEGSRWIEVDGQYAYVASFDDNGVQILDISDPTQPIGIAVLQDSVGGATELADANVLKKRGNYLYVGSWSDNGIQIFDVSDPYNPIALGVYTDASVAWIDDMVLDGKYLYITGGNVHNVTVLDISDPNNISLVGSITDGNNGADLLNFPRGLALVGNYLLVGTYTDDAVEVIDVSDPANMRGVGSIVDSGSLELEGATRIAVQGKYAYVVSRIDDGLQILELPTLTTPTADIGNLLSDDIETSYLTVTQALKTDSLNVNTNSMIGGTLTITGTASSALISSHSNVALNVTSGDVVIGTSTDVISGLQIGYGGICVDNDGECDTTVAGRIASVSTFSGNSDLAETYFSSAPLEPGDIVELESGLSINQAVSTSTNTIIGVVSTKPGVLLGYDDVSLEEGENAYPIALKGRVPVKVSTENGPINAGDQLMLSSIPGTAMKATGTGAVVGIALEAFDPDEDDPYYSDTFINQFTDDLPSTADVDTITEQLQASTTETIELDDTDVLQGQIVMFVDLDYRYLDTNTTDQLASLMGTVDSEYQGDNEDETLFDRITTLAQSFVDGVLSLVRLEVQQAAVEVVCIDEDTCVDGTQLQELLDRAGTITTPITEVVTSTTTPDVVTEETYDSDDEATTDNSSTGGNTGSQNTPDSTTPQTSTTTTNSGENTASSSDQISDNIETASTTTTGGDLVNDETASSSENSIVEPQNEDVQQEEVADETPVQEEPASEETPVSSEQETDETPEEDTPPEPEVVEEVDTPDEEEPVEEETDVNQETS